MTPLHALHHITGGFHQKHIEPKVFVLVRIRIHGDVTRRLRRLCNNFRWVHVSQVGVSEFELRINA